MKTHSEKRRATWRRISRRRQAEGRSTRQKLRAALLVRYGARCNHCGYEADARALQIDHVRNNGAEERRLYGEYGILRRALDDMTGAYQMLCANCNLIKKFEAGLSN